MKNSIIAFVLFVLILLPKANAQQMPFSSQYYSNQFITNPALTGNKGSTNAFVTHRSQWAGISGAPQTTYFTVDGKLKKDNVGLGLTAYSDVTDILSRSGFNASYSYQIKINSNNYFTFGMALGIINNRINFSKVVVNDPTDPILSAQQYARTVINADLGLAYNWKKLELGFAMPQVVGNKVNYKDNTGLTGTYNLARHYYGSVKYVFDVNQSRGITAYPLVMIRSVGGAPFQYDFNAVVDWRKFGWFGVTYHSNYAVAISAGLRYKSLSVGYAYDMGISKIRKYTGSTSEFLLSYNFGSPASDSGIKLDSLIQDIKKLKEQDSIQGALLDSLQEKDSIKTVLLDSLQKQVDSNTVEIEKLKIQLKDLLDKEKTLDPKNPGDVKTQEEIDKEKERLKKEQERIEKEKDSLKDAQDSIKIDVPQKTENKEGYITIPGGTAVKAGYYVIIGAFTSQDNAKIFARDAKRKGYQTAVIIQNRVNSIYEIVVFSTNQKDDAIQRLDGIKKDYPDVWVLTLE